MSNLYLMPSGKIAVQSGKPVLLTQSQFEDCCCEGDLPDEIFIRLCQVPGISPWIGVGSHSGPSGRSFSTPLGDSGPYVEQPNNRVVRLFYIASDDGSATHDVLLAKSGGLQFPFYFAYEYGKYDSGVFLWYLGKESTTGQWVVRVAVITSSSGTTCDALDYNQAAAAFDFVYYDHTGSIPTLYEPYSQSIRLFPTRFLPCIAYSSTATEGSTCNPTDIWRDHAGMYAVVGTNATTLYDYACTALDLPELEMTITPYILLDPALHPTWHTFNIQIDHIPCARAGAGANPWRLKWDWNDPSVTSSFSANYSDEVSSTGISRNISWSWVDEPPEYPLLPSYELVVRLEDDLGNVYISGSAWIFFSTERPEIDCGTWQPSASGGYEGASDLWPLMVDGDPIPVGSEIDLKFNTLSIPDKIDIIYDGKTYSTNWVGGNAASSYPDLTPYNQMSGGTGYWNAIFTKKEGLDTVHVIVYGSTSGTAWSYSLRAACAVDGVPDRTGFDTPPGENIDDGTYTIQK